MSYYNKIKKLDEESMQKLTDGTGPSDKCLCSVLSPPEDERSRLGSMGASIKKAFSAIGSNKKKFKNNPGQKSIDIPLVYTKGGHGIYTTKEVVKRGPCGKCSCDSSKVVLKHAFANIRITSPDVSTICPCPYDCLPNRAKIQDNITVTVEHVEVPKGKTAFSEAARQETISEESRQPSINEESRQPSSEESRQPSVSEKSPKLSVSNSSSRSNDHDEKDKVA